MGREVWFRVQSFLSLGFCGHWNHHPKRLWASKTMLKLWPVSSHTVPWQIASSITQPSRKQEASASLIRGIHYSLHFCSLRFCLFVFRSSILLSSLALYGFLIPKQKWKLLIIIYIAVCFCLEESYMNPVWKGPGKKKVNCRDHTVVKQASPFPPKLCCSFSLTVPVLSHHVRVLSLSGGSST